MEKCEPQRIGHNNNTLMGGCTAVSGQKHYQVLIDGVWTKDDLFTIVKDN